MSSTVVPINRENATREKINALTLERGLSQSQISRESGVSTTAMSRFLQGKYEGDNTAIEEKLHVWLAAFEDRLAQREALPTGPVFASTPSSERVIATLRYAQTAGDIVVIYGGAGVGKTKGIEEYQRQAPNVWHVTMTPASANVLASLEEIAEVLGERDYGSASRMHRNICRRVRGARGLLVIDEAQHLTVMSLDQIRSIHDATGVGIALVGNETVYARMAGGKRAAFLDRLWSRVGKRVYLQKSTVGDIDSFAKAWGVEDRNCLGTIREIASKPGALRVLAKVMRLALMHARAGERPLCCDDVRNAWNELGAMS